MHFRTVAILALSSSLSACMGSGLPNLGVSSQSSQQSGPTSIQTGDNDDRKRLQTVMELRRRYLGSSDTEGQQELNRAESEAAAYFLAAGSALAKAERYPEAIEKYELGLLAQPTNMDLQRQRQSSVERKEIARLYAEGQQAKMVGNTDLAQTLLQRAATLDAHDPILKKELAELDRSKRGDDQRLVLAAFRSASPVAVNFRDAKLKDALKTLCDPYALNFVFDKNADNLDVSVSARNVSFEQAFNMIMQSSNAAYKVLGTNSIFIYEDTPEKRKQYADRYFKTFHLSTLKAERMAEILKASMDVKTVFANNDLGTIQIRDTRETLEVAERLIATNDRKPAEIMLEVEILEIDRTKAEQLGLDYGSSITVQLPQVSFTDLANGAKLATNSVITFPTVTFNYLKTDVGARTLSNPRIRTVDGQPAKIHVGDRVPLQSSFVQDTTGQTRTLFEYHDIGIQLDVIPKYHLDGSIFVDLKIEVSSLGSNLGTAAQPAYAIGSRNVHTTMILRENETALLGGLIKEEEQHNMNGLPVERSGVSVLDRLFSTSSDKVGRSELLLTITPRLIRPQSFAQRSATDFYSGTEGTYSIRAEHEYLKKAPESGLAPRYVIKPDNTKPSAGAAASGGTPDGIQPTTYGR
ncbi:type II and III secretion system protein [Rhodomicrobium vannielii ATCC 17100]|uniref:Type II and III secretion system protein n=1 Tax=Rhodomicrobium vannielii (strain ATCC 17100 / DSM 162 / LMG 4299 / NCIMB 10020 / ATH 3.1.1) TaxID=648757 RepID=E3HZM5_RHOVT|nr:FecR domain-containing protein [Rhodomicrobium vannielii]ADP71060.1 type II and III secretion system protein [Rhodomicrobium vannielii ATCC 17100]